MQSTTRLLVLGLLGAALSLPLAATAAAPAADAPKAPPAAAAKPTADPRVAIAAKIPGARPEDLRLSPVPGIYELTRGADVVYVTGDGKYAFIGDLYDLPKNQNLSEDQRKVIRQRDLAAIPESDMVVFAPKNPRYTITVFTDVDCAYCRELHSHIKDFNGMGIKVRYLFYPRSGPNTESWTKAEQVWCSPDRNDALTRAKQGQALKTKACANNPVAKDYALGKSFNFDGTPAIVISDGELIPGYMPPDMLLAHLQEVHAH
jgi:thiol:disulfide interchange protein DsbC